MSWTLLAAAALAAVTFERKPEKDEEGALEPAPDTVVETEYREWRWKVQKRAVWAGIDAAVRWQADAVEACVAGRGGKGPAEASVELTVGDKGDTKVRAGKGGDGALAACVAEVLGGQRLPVVIQRQQELTYTVRWDGAAPTTAAPTVASELAFAPKVDEERGFAVFPWGAKAADYEELSTLSMRSDTRFYTRVADYRARWLGVPMSTITYGFGADGFYVATVNIDGTTAQWQVRELLTARYGPPKWDTKFSAYYWRGAERLVQLQPIPGDDDANVVFLDIARARKSGLADRLPGDREEPGAAESNRRMPRIFRDDAKPGEAAATGSPAAATDAPAPTSEAPAPEAPAAGSAGGAPGTGVPAPGAPAP